MIHVILITLFATIVFGLYSLVLLIGGRWKSALTIISVTAIFLGLFIHNYIVSNHVGDRKETLIEAGYSLIHVYSSSSERSFPSIEACEENTIIFLDKNHKENTFQEAKIALCILK